ncbi:hypothetical protein [Pseudomonas akapageensis]|uniref:hypothetical protein n=1 Tax=Pseudomonas akapageensis TaxID=2609961 RepID=UPI003CCDDD98
MNQPSPSTKNPLTIIAIFAGIIEASALASLPFLDEDSQSIYTWFLVGFPPFLTVLFFLTLNFNSKSLYSPSDFANEDDFLKVRDMVTTPERNELSANSDTQIETMEVGKLPPSLAIAKKKEAAKRTTSRSRPLIPKNDNIAGHQSVHIKSSFGVLHIIDSRALKDNAHLASILQAAAPEGNNKPPEAVDLLVVLLTSVKTESSIDAFLIDTLRSENKKAAPSCTVAIYNLDTLTLTTLIRQNPDSNRHPP